MRIKHYGILFGVLTGVILSQPAQAGGDLEEGAKLYAAGDYIKALPLLTRAAQFSPMSWQPHYYLGNTNLALGRMAAAKYEYELCKKTCTKPDIVARCAEGIARADKHSSQVRSSGSAPAASSSSSKSDDAASSDDAPKVPLTDAQVAANKRKEEIMKAAREEVTRIKKETKDQIESEKENANQRWRSEDGSVSTDIDKEREKEINRESEEKCRKVMETAERRAKSNQ